MAAAFLLEKGRRTAAEFTREVEEEGIKFNMENVAEDIVNGLFCTYEPPTSKTEQYKAAKAVRKDPTKYTYRPSVPKSILKWKVKKHKEKKASYSSSASEAPSVPPSPPASEERDDVNDGVVTVEKDKKSVTWRDQKAKGGRTEIENKVVGLASKYCGGACNSGEGIADILSSPTGRATQTFFTGGPETPGSMASMASSMFSKQTTATEEDGEKKVLYDDLGNPIREDDIQEDETGSYFPTTPKDAAAPTPMHASSNSKDPYNDKMYGRSNLFCSNIPFVDTVVEGIGIAGVMAHSAAVAAGVPENLCNPLNSQPPTETQLVRVSDAEKQEISEELKQAQESLGIYEPESYDQSTPNAVKLKRQSTPRHAPGQAPADEEDDVTQQQEQQPAGSSNRSYAHSDITMGNTTVNHFSENASLFDDTVGAEPATPKSPKAGGFNSMVDELKAVQLEKGLEGSSQHSATKEDNKSTASGFSSYKKDYERVAKSPKARSVMTNSYKKSLKSPSTPQQSDKEIFEARSGTVASLAKQFESPRSRTNQAAFRKSIDPAETRQFDGKLSFLPPTPRRKEPKSPSGYSMVGNKLEKFDWHERIGKTKASEVSANANAENREEASTKRPTSLVTGPETVEKDDSFEGVKKQSDPPQEKPESSSRIYEKKSSKKKDKAGKPKEGFSKKFKKTLRKVTKKVESQRIATDE